MYHLLASFLIILVLVPIIFYLGYSIYFKQDMSKTVLYLLFGFSVIIIIHYTIILLKILQGSKNSKIVSRNYGIFLIGMAILLFFYNISCIYHYFTKK